MDEQILSDELTLSGKEAPPQNQSDEFIIANVELAIQYEEKEKRAAELIIANRELAFQNDEKEKRAAELIIANRELAFQNEEKEKRAAELIIANLELVFQNDEKEKRAAELAAANKELAFQIEEKEKRTAELVAANKELVAFTYISSHDLQEPLRKIQSFAKIILDREFASLSDNGKDYFKRMQNAAARMQQLLGDLLAYSRINANERRYEHTDLNVILEDVISELKDVIEEKKATVDASNLCQASVIPFQFRQLMYNLISNALKFSRDDVPARILISSTNNKGSALPLATLSPEKEYCHIVVKDNGIGFHAEYNERIFEVFQKLHTKEEYVGTGIGLAIVKKIVDNHNGIITAAGEPMNGATFNIYFPVN